MIYEEIPQDSDWVKEVITFPTGESLENLAGNHQITASEKNSISINSLLFYHGFNYNHRIMTIDKCRKERSDDHEYDQKCIISTIIKYKYYRRVY